MHSVPVKIIAISRNNQYSQKKQCSLENFEIEDVFFTYRKIYCVIFLKLNNNNSNQSRFNNF